MNITASAPGKLVLLGEYAVLEGAPAISMAVDRRARASLTAHAGSRCEAMAKDILDATVPFSIAANGLPDWTEAGSNAKSLSLVDQVLHGLADAHLGPAGGAGFSLALDTQDFFACAGAARLKLGLGSSAALTVALASALAAHSGHESASADRDVWLERLLALHRNFQGGHGSGVDVATSLIGGIISYRLTPDAEGNRTRPNTADLVWPGEIQRLFVWSGCSASTPKLLSTLKYWREAHRADYDAMMAGLIEIAEVAVKALSSGDANGFIRAAAAYAEGLQELGDASGVHIFSDEHLRIRELANEAGMVYKPCGAGGGDVGVVFGLDAGEQLAGLKARLATEGFECVSLAVDETGLELGLTKD